MALKWKESQRNAWQVEHHHGHHGFLLCVVDGGCKQANAEAGHEEQARCENNKRETASHWHAKPLSPEDEDFKSFNECKDDIRQ